MAVLLIAEVNGGELSVDSTAKALTAAKQMGDVTVLCVGSGCSSAAEAVAKLDGVSKVLCAQNDAYGHDLAEPVAALIVSLAGDYSHIVAPSTSASKNILPRVAALLDVMVISEVTAVIDAETFERPIYAGNAIQTVKSTDATKVATIRTSTFDATGEGGAASVTSIDAAGDPGEEHMTDPEAVEGFLRVHRGVDHAHAAGEEQQVVAFEAHLLEDDAVDPPSGDTGSAFGQDGFVGFDLRRVGGHDRDEGTGTLFANCFECGRCATASETE